MSLLPETKEIQTRLANYCRTGQLQGIPGINSKHVQHYRRLVFNVIADILSTAYPITRKYIKATDWDLLTEDFFANHPCSNPQVWKMPKEFYGYVVKKKWDIKWGYTWLNDLLAFEWAELEVHTMADKKMPVYNIEGNISTDKIIITPEWQLLKSCYPVHLYPPNELEGRQGTYYILIFRTKEGDVEFFDLSELYARLIYQIEKIKYLDKVLAEAKEILPAGNSETIKTNCITFLQALHQKGFVLGFK